MKVCFLAEGYVFSRVSLNSFEIGKIAFWTGNNLLTRSGAVVGWGIAAGFAALFLTERLPMFRRDIYSRIPLLGDRYADYRVEDEEASEDGEE